MSGDVRRGEPFGGTNVAWMRGCAERYEHKGVIDLNTIGRVTREAADEIDRLRAERDRLKRELDLAIGRLNEKSSIICDMNTELAEKDKRIAELEAAFDSVATLCQDGVISWSLITKESMSNVVNEAMRVLRSWEREDGRMPW